MHLSESLKRGIGVHHSGILPIMKEIIELLFQRGLIKILFATETFAMGINMPARTVIFDSMRKHDGMKFRSLLAGEYIQMAGRAGRRGLDKTGTVIILCKAEVFETSELQQITMGKASQLESKFRITYSMILSLLRNKDMRIQDFMKRSFSEHKLTSESPMMYESAIKYLESVREKREKLSCVFCLTDLNEYYYMCNQYSVTKGDLIEKLKKHYAFNKTLLPGRIVFVKGFDGNSAKLYPLLLLETFKDDKALALSLDQFQVDDEAFKRYQICKKIYESDSTGEYSKLIERLKQFDAVFIEIPLIRSFLVSLKSYKDATVMSISLENVEAISKKQIKLTQSSDELTQVYRQIRSEISQDEAKFRVELNSKLTENKLFTNLAIELFNYLDATQSQLTDENSNESISDILDYTKDLNIRDIDFTNIYLEFKNFQSKMAASNCITCPKFAEHVSLKKKVYFFIIFYKSFF